MSIWKTLSAIDVNEHTDKKGNFTYLSWTWAWATVKDNYPESRYALLDDTHYPDGTVEVRVEVIIDGLSHVMWLPVLNFKNKAIENPNAFDINSARMRCLVKCLAMFGLGHYIYAGESTPQESDEVKHKLSSSVKAVLDGIEAEDHMKVRETWDELTGDERDQIWKEFNTKQKASIRECLQLGAKEKSTEEKS